ncbi:MAG: hypothetical protein AAF502_10980 [Bacteroidota bacterium]
MKQLLFLPSLCLVILFSCQPKSAPELESELPQVPICGPEYSDLDYKSEKKAPLFDGLGMFSYEITTNSEEAQRYFNQGLILAYGFNHAEAARSFVEASRIDPDCGMCYWGLAYVLGPNYNAGMDPSVREDAVNAIENAWGLRGKYSEKEKALIAAMKTRYPVEEVDDRTPYDQAYANAMKDLAAKYPDDDDILTMYAESIMNLHPWDLWTKDGLAQPWTPQIVETLTRVLDRSPGHPGAHHFYVHAVEASTEPEKAMQSADTLMTLVPGSGHLVHMPSHIYIRTGRYHEGTLSNELAVEVDRKYVSACHAAGAYPLAYYPHNYHFLAATAALEGASEKAIKAAYEVAEHSDKKLMKEPGWGTLQHYFSIPYYVLPKFEKWDEILEVEAPENGLDYPKAMWHYMRGMAFNANDDQESAGRELQAIKAIAEKSGLEEITIWDINSVDVLIKIAKLVLEARIEEQGGNYDKAATLLKEAIVIEDNLNYNEPPDWFFSVRHYLGPVLLKANKPEEAEAVYAKDLFYLPENGYALLGMYHSLKNQGKDKAAADYLERFEKAWQWADFELKIL